MNVIDYYVGLYFIYLRLLHSVAGSLNCIDVPVAYISTVCNLNMYQSQLIVIAVMENITICKIYELVIKHSRSIRLQSITTLRKPDTLESEVMRPKFTYNEPESCQLSNSLKKFNISCVFDNMV